MSDGVAILGRRKSRRHACRNGRTLCGLAVERTGIEVPEGRIAKVERCPRCYPAPRRVTPSPG